MSNDPLKNWQLEEGKEPLDQWKLQDAEQDTRHLQLQQGGATPSDWQPVEYQRPPTRGGRNWVLPSIVIVALLVALGYVGFVTLNRLGTGGVSLGPITIGAPAAEPSPTPAEAATDAPAAAVVTEAPTEAPTAVAEPPTPTPTQEPPTPTPAFITTRVGTINQAAGLNARSEPSTTGEIVRLLNNGERVTVVRQEGEWLLVILPENVAAWAWAEFVDQAVGEQKTLEEWNAILAGAGLPPVAIDASAAPTPAPETPANVTLAAAVIADPGGTLRLEPATQAQVVGDALLGATLTASGRTDASDWLLVTLADGRRGWIAANLVSIDGDVATLTVQPANLLLTENVVTTPVQATPTPVPATVAFTLETNDVIPAAPFTNTLPTVGPAIAISDTAGVRARSSPSLEGDVLGFLPNGAVLPVVGRSADNAWVQVTLPDNQRAWVFREVVTVSSDIDTAPIVGADGAVAIPTPTAAAPAGNTGEPTVTVKSLLGANLRTAPDNESDTLDTASLGTAFPAIGRSADNTWIQVRLTDGGLGWLLANTVDLNIDIATLPVAP